MPQCDLKKDHTASTMEKIRSSHSKIGTYRQQIHQVNSNYALKAQVRWCRPQPGPGLPVTVS